MTEEWKPVVGYEGLYEVCQSGKVRNQKTQRVLKERDSHGYKRVVLYHGSKASAKAFQIHRLVAEAFLGPKPFPGAEVNHKDEDRANNVVANLEWCDRGYNMNYRDNRKKVRKPVVQMDLNGNEVARFASCKEAAHNTGAHQGVISNACAGRCQTAGGFKWRYV